MEEQAIKVVHDSEQHYFKINVDNHCAYLAYAKMPDGSIDIYRTFVPDDLRGQGLAEHLAKAALAFADQHQSKVIPSCSYIESYMKRIGRLS